MKVSIIDMFIIFLFIGFSLQSCENKTSPIYEVGKSFGKMKSEFIQGSNDFEKNQNKGVE